jgi:predicted transcriptional regulator
MSSQTIVKREDADVIVRMLYYCSEPKIESQIKSYCEIDSVQFEKFANHCFRHALLRKYISRDAADEGELYYVVTDEGRKTLATAQQIMKALGLNQP